MAFTLSLDPVEKITFKGPFEAATTSELEICNSTEKRQAWKVKCTDNELFQIEPVVGVLNPEEKATVNLTMIRQDAARAHRFVVYQKEAADDAMDARGLWTAATGAEPFKELTIEMQHAAQADADAD